MLRLYTGMFGVEQYARIFQLTLVYLKYFNDHLSRLDFHNISILCQISVRHYMTS
jgi:hypothetical protein